MNRMTSPYAARRPLLGLAAACLSSLLGGSAVVATRFAVAEIGPVALAALRYGLGALLLGGLVLLWQRQRLTRRDWLPVLLLGALFFAAFPALFSASLAHTTAARGALALASLPFLTLLVAALLGREKLSALKLAGVLLALAGVTLALIAGRDLAAPPGAWRGDLLMLLTALLGAIFNALARPYMARLGALGFTAWAMLAGAVMLNLVAWDGSAREAVMTLSGAAWAAIAYLGVIGAALIFYLWSLGLAHASPTQVAVTVALNPVSAMTLGALLLHEPVGGTLPLGLGAVLLGIAAVNWPQSSPAPVPPAPPAGPRQA